MKGEIKKIQKQNTILETTVQPLPFLFLLNINSQTQPLRWS